MQTMTTIGLDIAKSVFQVHGVDNVGQVVIGISLGALLLGTLADRLRKRGVATPLDSHRPPGESGRSVRI
jgi:hypothetical protein